LITNGDLHPGTRLIEVEVSQKLGVSRGPVREALRILESEGLVVNHPGRGSFVVEISQKDILETYSLRALLEQEAIRLAIERSAPEDIAELEAILADMFAAAADGDRGGVLDRDLAFHRRIWRITGHSRLEAYLEELAIHSKMYVAVQTAQYADLAAGISDHNVLLDALKTRDTKLATETLKEHLRVATETLLAYARGGAGPDDSADQDQPAN
jgi:DNA-binding GntR family transcriptional regulator